MATEALDLGNYDNGTKEEDDDDEFAGILEETNTSPRDDKVANMAAVNYKMSTEDYEKVDLFQTSSSSSVTLATEEKSTTHQDQSQTIHTADGADGDGIKDSQPQHLEPSEEHQHQQAEKPNNSAIFQPSNQSPPSSPVDTNRQPQTSITTEHSVSSLPAAKHQDDEGTSQDSGERLSESPTEPSEQLLKAQAEWDAVGTIQPDGSAGDASGKYGPASGQTPTISFNESLAHFQRSDMSQFMSKIKPTVQRSGWASIRHFIMGPPKMKSTLHEERNLVFAIAQCPFDDNSEVHKRVLQTVYKQLTGSTIDCPRFGAHWEQIGFQGNDPSTDLRGTGFLGLMTLLHFLMDPDRLTLAKEIYKLSTHETQNFPFCVMSINMTRISIQALREEHLSRECNRRKQVLAVVNDFYTGIFLMLFQIWKQQHKTIADSGFVIKDVEDEARKNPREVIRCLQEYLQDKKSSGHSAKNGETARGQTTTMNFSGVHELDEEEDEDGGGQGV